MTRCVAPDRAPDTGNVGKRGQNHPAATVRLAFEVFALLAGRDVARTLELLPARLPPAARLPDRRTVERWRDRHGWDAAADELLAEMAPCLLGAMRADALLAASAGYRLLREVIAGRVEPGKGQVAAALGAVRPFVPLVVAGIGQPAAPTLPERDPVIAIDPSNLSDEELDRRRFARHAQPSPNGVGPS